MSQSTIDSFIQQNILKIHKHILNKKTKLIDSDLTYVHLLNEYYSIVIVFTNKRRKYEILGKKIYLHCQKTSDKQFLIRKLLLDYWNKTVPQMFRF
jgi:hypothetical protein